MSTALSIIESELKSKQVIGRLTMALGLNPTDEAAQREAWKYAASVLAEVEKTAGDKNKDLSVCKPQSIAQCMIDSARLGLMIDGRQHAHMIRYGNAATLQVGFRGYVAKIVEHHPDAIVTAEPVFDGDTFSVEERDGFQSYTHTRLDPFEDSIEKMRGVFCAVAYTVEGRLVQKVTTMSMAEIGKVRKCAKQDFIWNQWFIEKAKAACIKRACKLRFTEIQGLRAIIDYDNQNNFKMPQSADDADALNKATAPEGEEVATQDADTEAEQEPLPWDRTD